MTTRLRTRLDAVPRGARAVALASSALLAAVLIPSTASAAEVTVPAARTAWFWDSAEKVTTCTEDGVQNVCGDVSPAKGVFGNAGGASTPITQGHLGIGVRDGESDMRAYVRFDTDALPFGATVSSFIATFTVSKPDQAHADDHGEAPGAKAPATINESGAVIQVCAVATPWGSSEGDPPSSTTVIRPRPDQGGNTQPETTSTKAEPEVNCGLSTTALFSKDGKTLTANITEIAQAWASGAQFNEGIALLPVAQGTRPTWTVELHGVHTTATGADGSDITYVSQAEQARARVSYTATSTPPPPPPSGGEGPDFPSFGDPIPTNPGPPLTPAFGDPPPTTPPAQGPTTPVGAAKGQAPVWFFGLFPLGFLVLGLVSGMIGPDPVAPGFVGTPSRVASVLRTRRLEDQ